MISKTITYNGKQGLNIVAQIHFYKLKKIDMKKKKILTFVLIAFSGGIFAIGTTSATPKDVRYTPAIISGNVDFTFAAELSVHAVVHITTEYQQKSAVYDDFFGEFWDPWGFFNNQGYQYKPDLIKASGSGVILTDDGYIVTNNHVVQGASSIEVTLNDKRTYDGKIIGTDPGTDLALIKIEEKYLPYLAYGNSDSVKLGEWVLAVGNPFNLTSTVTAGIISAKARNLNILGKNSSIESFLQTDAVVNPGNSGGALVNTSGQLVGINAAIASNTGSYAGYSFAIPVNIVKKVVNDLLQYGEVQRAYLGVTFEEIDSKLAKEKGLTKVKGLYVTSVTQGGSADESGIKEGDIITKIGNSIVNTSPELQETIITYKPSDKVVVSFIHNGEEKEASITLKNKNGGIDIVKKDDSNVISTLGASFETLSSYDMKTLGIEYGLKISKLEEGLFLNAGIHEGFIITEVDKRPVKTIDDLKTALENKKGGVLIGGIYPNGMRAYYGFGM
jgi:Do/DeqQ family serine protease